jgi:hypothetical protein
MLNFRSGNSKANIEYEAFKKKYDTKSFKTEFKQKYEAAIKEIKSNKGPPMAATTNISKVKQAKASNYTSHQALIEYYVNAKLVDAELYTILIFNKLNEFAKIPPESPDYNKIKALNLVRLVGDSHDVVKRNIEMFKLIESTLLVSADAGLHKNPEFIHLLVLLLTIRYYSFTLLDTIFQNGKNNIESIIKNITTMNNHTEAIQTIVDRIDEPSPIVNPDGSTTYPDGSTTYSDGRTTYPDGSTSYPDGRIVTATGITTRPDNTIVDADGTTIKDLATVAAVEAQNAALKNFDANMPGSINNPRVQASNYLPQQQQQSGNFLGFDFSRFLPTGGGQIGGVNDDVVTILNTISRAQVANDPAISQLVKYSTNILCNALALLSVSISFPSVKSPSLLAIMPEVYTNITNYFINLIFTEQNLAKFSSLADLKKELIRVIMENSYENIISNITKISNIPNTNNTITTVASGDATAVEPVVYNRPDEDTTTILNENAAHDSVRDLIDQQLGGEDPSLIANAKDAGNKIITSYYSNGRLSADYTTEVATAIVSVFQAYKLSYSPKDIADVCTIAAANSKHDTDYRAFVNKFFDKAKDLLETKTKIATVPPVQLTGGGALSKDYNFEFNLQASIIKGIEGSTFFRLNNILTEPEVVVAKKEGGQRTQKNRKINMNRGGTRRNINFNNSNNYNNSNV